MKIMLCKVGYLIMQRVYCLFSYSYLKNILSVKVRHLKKLYLVCNFLP